MDRLKGITQQAHACMVGVAWQGPRTTGFHMTASRVLKWMGS
jgi:hypothetical protein